MYVYALLPYVTRVSVGMLLASSPQMLGLSLKKTKCRIPIVLSPR